MIGFLSLTIEATLGMPQLLSNYRTKSVAGLSFVMIFSWFVGDFFKTLYFIIEVKSDRILVSTDSVHYVWCYSGDSG